MSRQGDLAVSLSIFPIRAVPSRWSVSHSIHLIKTPAKGLYAAMTADFISMKGRTAFITAMRMCPMSCSTAGGRISTM